MASTYLGYCIFILQMRNSWTYLSVLPQNHVPGPDVGKSSCRLQNCHA